MSDAAQREYVAHAYRAHGHSVLRRARQILGNEQEARDVLQEIFIGLLDRPQQFQGRSALATYLYSVTTHACLNRLRDQRNRGRLRGEQAEELAPSRIAGAPDTLLALRQILGMVPEDEARAAVHHHLDGMSHAEVAELLGCSRRRVGDLLERLRARLSHSELEHMEVCDEARGKL
ncbi:MAG: sigma-70 family RNA polymerase sigma factor [Polyangiaceae bacterium]